MRKDAAEAREKAARLLAYAEALEAAADIQEGLRSRHGYATVRTMDTTVDSTEKAGRRGPVATAGPMLEVAKALGLDSLQALATLLGEHYDNIRSINSRVLRGKGTVPTRIKAKIEALKAARKK